MPYGTTGTKLDRIRFYGARVMIMGGTYNEALALGINYLDCNELFYVDPGTYDVRVCAGLGTIGYEIALQHPKVDTIVCPVGRGGLMTGVAVGARAVRPDMRIVGVQTAACPSVYQSINDGFCYRNYPIEGETVCGAVVGGAGQIAYEMLPDLVDQWVISFALVEIDIVVGATLAEHLSVDMQTVAFQFVSKLLMPVTSRILFSGFRQITAMNLTTHVIDVTNRKRQI